jgi:hypothetical protein
MKPFLCRQVWRVPSAVFAALLFGLVPPLLAQPELNREYKPNQALLSTGNLQPIFNATNLSGWVIRGGKAHFAVEDGVIVGTTTMKGGVNTFLCTEREYGDFVLELEIKADPELNSGVQIRSQMFDRPTTYEFGAGTNTIPAHRVHGYQVEVDHRPERRWSGGIYEEARRGWLFPVPTNAPASTAFQRGEWNQFRIECRGASLRTWVNGVPVADLVDAELLTGFIGLQVHSADEAGLRVRFRNIRLRDLGSRHWNTAWDCRSMDGMDQSGGAQWQLEDGVLRGRQSAQASEPGLLMGRTPLRDFTVRMKYKIQRGAFVLTFRSSTADPAKPPLQYAFDDTISAKIARRRDWNTITIAVRGTRLVMSLNGHQLQDVRGAVASDGLLPGLVLPASVAADVSFKAFEVLSEVE